jgi:hypothetical protein
MSKQKTNTGQKIEDLKITLLYALLGAGTVAGTLWGASYLYHRLRKTKAQGQSLTEGSPATYAKQLKMAFENDNVLGWGTDEEQVFRVLTTIESQEAYKKVQKAYTDLYQRNLNADLEDELDSAEYNKAISILSSKKIR